MTYSPVKIIILTFLIGASAAGSSFAQNNMEAMRFLTINSLMDYGQKLYDRGDYNEASAVFNHVLIYDSHQAQALQYLKNMGQASASILNIGPSQAMVGKAGDHRIHHIDLSDTGSLKKAIEAKKRSIEKLRIQIMQMRADIIAESSGE